MDNSSYNSLTSQLIQNGILSSSDSFHEDVDKENFFEVSQDDKNQNNPIDNRKRLNRIEYETDINLNTNKEKTNNDFVKSKKEKFFIRFFPKLYKAYLAKNALKELTELDIDTNELLNKTIPYGEEESRYKNLIKYLKYANDLQIKIKNKFK